MSKYFEIISDFFLHDSKTQKEFNTILNTETMPFGRIMLIAFVFVNIQANKEYSFKVYVNNHLISLTNVKLKKESLIHTSTIDGKTYGLVGGEVDFSLALEEYGPFEIRCDLTHENEVVYSLKKVYMMIESVE